MFFSQNHTFWRRLSELFFENQGEQTCQTIKHFHNEDPEKIVGNNKTTFVRQKILHKSKYEEIASENLEKKAISLLGQQVKINGIPDVFYPEENSELKTSNLKVTKELFLSSVIDTFEFKLLKEREFF